MNNIVEAAYNYMAKNHPAGYEFMIEMAWRCQRAVKTGDILELYGDMILFKPDDRTTETFTAANISNYVHKSQLDSFVRDLANH